METIEQAYNKILTDENLMESITHGTNRYPFDFSMMIWHYLILIVLNGTGTQNWSLYMLNLEL